MANENKKPQRINYTELLLIAWFIESCTLGPNLISQFIAPPLARTLFTITSIAILILLILGKIKHRKEEGNGLPNHTANIVIVAGFTVYIISLIFACLHSYTANLGDSISRILLFITFMVANICMTEKVFAKCMDRYCQLMTLFSICAIIVSLVVLILKIPPVNEFVAPEGRVYQNYIIAFTEAEVDTLRDFKRAASFYDEPGTFAMFLTPAIFWTVLIRPSKFTFFTLLFADLLTFSIGGWVAFAVSLIYVVKIYPELIKKYQFVIVSIFMLLGIVVCFNLLLQFVDITWLSDYYNYKFEGEGMPGKVSSAGTRQNEIDTFFTTIAENPLGYGVKSPQIPIFSVGFMGSSIEGGLLGTLGYCICFLGMILNLIQHLFVSRRSTRSRYTVPILGSILSLIIMSFQRIDMLSFYSGIFMLSFLVNCPMPEKQQLLVGAVDNLPDWQEETKPKTVEESIAEEKVVKSYSMGQYLMGEYITEEEVAKEELLDGDPEENINYPFF